MILFNKLSILGTFNEPTNDISYPVPSYTVFSSMSFGTIGYHFLNTMLGSYFALISRSRS